MTQTAEVVLIGGGIIGASIAYHLRQDGFAGRILVIERDTTYARAATPMSLGGIGNSMACPVTFGWPLWLAILSALR